MALIVLKRRPMVLIGPRSADHVHLSTGGAAIFGRQDAFYALNFGDGFDAHNADLILAAICTRSARLRIGNGVGAVDGDRGSSFSYTIQPDVAASGDSGCVFRYTGRLCDKAHNVAAREREIANL